MNDPEPVTIGYLQTEISRLRKEWNDKDRVDTVLETAQRELARIQKEREDYYGNFGQ